MVGATNEGEGYVPFGSNYLMYELINSKSLDFNASARGFRVAIRLRVDENKNITIDIGALRKKVVGDNERINNSFYSPLVSYPLGAFLDGQTEEEMIIRLANHYGRLEKEALKQCDGKDFSKHIDILAGNNEFFYVSYPAKEPVTLTEEKRFEYIPKLSNTPIHITLPKAA